MAERLRRIGPCINTSKTGEIMPSIVRPWVLALWVVNLLLGAATFLLWVVFFLPDANVDSARWTLSALVQSMAAILGLAFIALTFLWSQGEASLQALRDQLRTYSGILQSGGRTVTRPDGQHETVPLVAYLRYALVSELEGKSRQEQARFHRLLYGLTVLQRVVMRIDATHWLSLAAIADYERFGKARGDGDPSLTSKIARSQERAARHEAEQADLLLALSKDLRAWPNEDARSVADMLQTEMERHDFLTGVSRAKRFSRARGPVAGITIITLCAAIVLGLAVLSGYNEGTSKFWLAAPVLIGGLGTGAIVNLVLGIIGMEHERHLF